MAHFDRKCAMWFEISIKCCIFVANMISIIIPVYNLESLLQPKEVNNRGYHFAFMKNPDDCIGCAACATVCPDGCIEVYRVKVPD